jgi:hypothetical protein
MIAILNKCIMVPNHSSQCSEVINSYTRLEDACLFSSNVSWEFYIWTTDKIPKLSELNILFLENRKPLRRPRCRWVDNIKIDLR